MKIPQAMKNLYRMRTLTLAALFTMLSFSITAAEYYVVIGTFAQEANARKFAKRVGTAFKDVTYSFNETRKLYYVHVMKTSRKEEARNWTLYLRKEKGFRDAWVLAFPEVRENSLGVAGPQEHRAPRYVQEGSHSIGDDNALASSSSTDEFVKYDLAQAGNATSANVSWTVNGDISFTSGLKNLKDFTRDELLSTSQRFTFVVENAEGKVLPVEVMLVNYEKVKKIAGFMPGEEVAIRGAKKNQMVTFVCDELGYSMETKMFNIDNPSRGRDIKQKEDGVWEVRFKLKKLQVNEISFMNKTNFYKDAAVLEPSSEQEMNNLVLMMQANPGYKIIVHTHCNPGGPRDIRIPAGKNYFDLEGAVEKSGSDKQLTKKRAEVLRNYLVEHGIQEKRIGVVAWGSRDPLVARTAPDAYINDRVEVELVAE